MMLLFRYIDGANNQPDGGVLEGCCIIDLSGLHTTQHWHDVPCANRDTNQYLCKKIIIGTLSVFHSIITTFSTAF